MKSDTSCSSETDIQSESYGTNEHLRTFTNLHNDIDYRSLTKRKKVLHKKRLKHSLNKEDTNHTIGESMHSLDGVKEELVQGKLSSTFTIDNWCENSHVHTNVTVAISHLEKGEEMVDGNCRQNSDGQPVDNPVDLCVKTVAGTMLPKCDVPIKEEKPDNSFSTNYGTGPDPTPNTSQPHVVDNANEGPVPDP